MKKIRIALSFCSVFLLFACTSDDLDDNTVADNIETNNSASKSKYINLEELKKDNSSFLKFEQMNIDLNTLRYSKIDNTNKFDFLINTEKILLVQDQQSKTFTFPIYRLENNQALENLVLKINNDGTSDSYLVTYNFSDSDKTKIRNGEALDLTNKTEILPLTHLIKAVNSAPTKNSTSKGFLRLDNKCYELTGIKIIENTANVNQVFILYQIQEAPCAPANEVPSGGTGITPLDPTAAPEMNLNPIVFTQDTPPLEYSQLPYTLGNDFSSYPVLDDINEANNVSARNFFDSLTINERKWALYNGILYTRILQRLTELNWNYDSENLARDVINQMVQYHQCDGRFLNYEIEAMLFDKVMAGGRLTTVNGTCQII